MTLRPDELELVRRVVADKSAIQLEAGKEYLIESRLETLARIEGHTDASTIVAELRQRPSGPMTQKVVEAMTTNETSFFRDRAPFDTLRDEVLPRLIEARRAVRQLTIWCGAASTGQEPYSIAMLLRDHFPELGGWQVRIVATDLSTEVLEIARRGRYSQLEVNRGLPADMLVRYFDREGSRWQIRSHVRDLVDFRELNLVGAWPHLGTPDVVFLRNVMIYFDVESRRRILSKIASLIARDGALFLGAGETTLDIDPSFERVDAGGGSCFRLAGRTAPSSGSPPSDRPSPSIGLATTGGLT